MAMLCCAEVRVYLILQAFYKSRNTLGECRKACGQTNFLIQYMMLHE